MYKIKEIKKQFNKSKVLKGINFKVDKGDIVAIVGENGAGKTTFLKIMLNLLDKDSGEVLFKGKTIESYKNNLYKYIGVILEGQNNLYNYIPGIENIYYSGAMMGLSKKEVENRSNKYLKLFDLEDAKFKNTGDYSTGMLQKLAIVIALLGEPEILFLDEPTLGLDIKSNNELISVLKKLKKEKNITIILTSHDVQTIEKLATKVAYLKNGVIAEYDEIEKFKI